MIHLAVNLAVFEHQVEWGVPSVPTHWYLVPVTNILSRVKTTIISLKRKNGYKSAGRMCGYKGRICKRKMGESAKEE